jgi:hypothetical protein
MLPRCVSSRHAKNEMRLYGIAPVDGLTGPDANGRAIIVVVAGDDPDFVITTFPND